MNLRQEKRARGVHRTSAAILLSALVGALAVTAALAQSEGKTVSIPNARGYAFCEIEMISGNPPVLNVYNTTGASNCPPNEHDALNANALAQQENVDMVLLPSRRWWVMDQNIVYGVGATKDFGGVKANWVTSFPVPAPMIEAAKAGAKEFGKPYSPNTTGHVATFVYLAGKPIFIIRDTKGTAYVMQAYTNAKDPSMTLARLSELGSTFKLLPAGWKYETKTLDQTLTMKSTGPTIALSDEFGDVYQACGLQNACTYMP